MEKNTFTKDDLTLALSRSGIDLANRDSAQREDSREIEQLKSIIKALGAKVHQLLEDNKNATAAKQTSEHESQAHFIQLKQTILGLQQSLKEKESHLQTREKELAALTTQVRILERNAHSHPAPSVPKAPLVQPQNQTNAYIKVMFEKQQLEDEAAALRCEKIATSRHLNELVKNNSSLHKELQIALETGHALRTSLSETEQNLKTLQEENARLSREFAAEKELSSSRALVIREKELQINNEHTKNQENGARIQTLEATLFEVSEALSFSRQHEEDLKAQNEEISKLHKQLQEEQSLLQEAFRKKIEEVASLHELLALRTQELDNCQTSLDNQNQAFSSLENAHARLNEERQHLREELSSTETTLATTKEALRDVERELTRLKAHLSRYSLAERLTVQLYEIFHPQDTTQPARPHSPSPSAETLSFLDGNSSQRTGQLF